MGSYVDSLKSANPDLYNKIANLAKYTADENFGGQLQDYQAEIFAGLDPATLASVPKTIDFNAATNADPNNRIIGNSEDNWSQVIGYKKPVTTTSGTQIFAEYDPSGNLTGYSGNPMQRSFLNGNQSVSGQWDVTGKATPQQHSSSGGGVFGDLSSAFNELPDIAKLAAAYYGGSAIYDALGAGTAAGADLAALPAGSEYVAPEVTTLGTVAGPTEGMASGTALSDVGATENAYTAAQDAQDALAMQGNPAANEALTGVGAIGAANAYPALNAAAAGDVAAAGGTTAAALKAAGLGAAGAAGGTALADILPYTTGAGVVGSLLSANAAKSAADTQSAAAQQAIAQQQANFNTINAQQAPYRAAGYGALNKLANLGSGQTQQYDASGNPIGATTGASDYLTHQFNAQDLKSGLAPNYDFMLQQGQMANQRAANAGGGAIGGNALQGLNKYTQDYAGNAYQNAFNNYQTQRNNIYNTLAGIAGIGQTGQNATNTAATNATNAATQLGVGSAAAQAAGQTGSANAYTNAINQGVNNYTLASLLNQRGNVQLPVQG